MLWFNYFRKKFNWLLKIKSHRSHKSQKSHLSHLETSVSVMGASLEDYARIQLLSFLYKVLHVRHPCYLFSLFRFASSARTRNLVVPAHRSLAMSQSFVVLGCRAWNALPHAMKILPTRASFVSAVRRMVRGVDASNWVICVLARVFCFCGTHHVVEC
jgi:hypothetical protein